MAKKASAKKIRVGLIGAKGRLGSAITTVLEKEFGDRLMLDFAIDRDSTGALSRHSSSVEVILDVSMPTACEQNLKDLAKAGLKIPYVIGCTGWTEAQLKSVHAYAKKAPVVLAPNFSPAVNLFLGLIEQAAPLLKKWGYDVVVHETHHTKKLDAPSGTAKAVVECLGNMKAQVHSSRAGNIVGTHEVTFTGPGDILSLTHEALDRTIFARGAVLAAEWAAGQTAPRLYSMKEVVFGSD